MSFCEVAMVAATKAVTPPITAIVASPVGRHRQNR